MSKIKNTVRLFALSLCAVIALPYSPALAQSSYREGNIVNIAMAEGYNFGFRIFLSANGSSAVADCANNFAYVNSSDDNYSIYVQTLIEAWKQGKIVGLLINKDNNDLCHISYVHA